MPTARGWSSSPRPSVPPTSPRSSGMWRCRSSTGKPLCRTTSDSPRSSGNAASQTNLNITNPGHPLAAGLTAGVRTVATAAGDFSWGEPGGSPIIIARLNDGSNHPCLYAYEAGAAMSSGTAPARRVHLFLQNDTFASLNADGLKLFDAAVGWAVPARFQPPVLQGGQLQTRMGGRRHAPNRDQRAGDLERYLQCGQSLPAPHHQLRAILSREAIEQAKLQLVR